MQLAEGSVVLVNLVCECGERRVLVLEGKQVLKCRQYGHESTALRFTRQSNGTFTTEVW